MSREIEEKFENLKDCLKLNDKEKKLCKMFFNEGVIAGVKFVERELKR